MKNIINEFGKAIIVALVIISIIGVTAGLSINNNSVVKSSITNLIKGLPDSGGLNNSGGNSSGGNTSGGNSGSNVDYGKPLIVGDLSATADDNVKFTLYDSGVGVLNGKGNVIENSDWADYDLSWDYIAMYLSNCDDYDNYSETVYDDVHDEYNMLKTNNTNNIDKLIIDEDVNFPIGLVISGLPITDLEIKGNVSAPFLEIADAKNLKNINIANTVNIESFAGFNNGTATPTIDNIDFLQNDSFKYCKGVPDGYTGFYASNDRSYLGNVVNINVPDKFTNNTFVSPFLSKSSIIKNITYGKNFKSITDYIYSDSIETIRFKSNDKFVFLVYDNKPLCYRATSLKDIYLPENIIISRTNKNLFKINNTVIIHCPNEKVKEIVLANGVINPDNVVID